MPIIVSANQFINWPKLHDLNSRFVKLKSKYTEIIPTLLLGNCLVFMWFQGVLPGMQTVLIVSHSNYCLPTHEEWIALCWPEYIFGQGIIIESYWPWITVSYPAFMVLIFRNMSIHGCMLPDTVHLGIIPHPNLSSNEGCTKQLEKASQGCKNIKLSAYWTNFYFYYKYNTYCTIWIVEYFVQHNQTCLILRLRKIKPCPKSSGSEGDVWKFMLKLQLPIDFMKMYCTEWTCSSSSDA